MGRFMSPDWSQDPDPVAYADLENPQTLNLFGYTHKNPLSGTDPDGHFRDNVIDCGCQDVEWPESWTQFFHNIPQATVDVFREDAQWVENLFGKKTPVAPPVAPPANTANPNPDAKQHKKRG
jgi:hypothetical protein